MTTTTIDVDTATRVRRDAMLRAAKTLIKRPGQVGTSAEQILAEAIEQAHAEALLVRTLDDWHAEAIEEAAERVETVAYHVTSLVPVTWCGDRPVGDGGSEDVVLQGWRYTCTCASDGANTTVQAQAQADADEHAATHALIELKPQDGARSIVYDVRVEGIVVGSIRQDPRVTTLPWTGRVGSDNGFSYDVADSDGEPAAFKSAASAARTVAWAAHADSRSRASAALATARS